MPRKRTIASPTAEIQLLWVTGWQRSCYSAALSELVENPPSRNFLEINAL
jgi:hypothetical protein